MANEIIGKTMEGRQLKTDGGSDRDRPVTVEASIGDSTVAGSATPLLKFVGTTTNTSSGGSNLSPASATYDNPGNPIRAVMVEVEANQTTGALVSGKVYTIVSLRGSDVFTNIHSGSTDYDGLVFTATGTTPTTWTAGSVLENTQQYWMRLYAMGT
jgi:hypothetical protein